jgi:hypothetical protein
LPRAIRPTKNGSTELLLSNATASVYVSLPGISIGT